MSREEDDYSTVGHMKRPPVLLAAFFVLQFLIGAGSKKNTALPMSGNELLLAENILFSPLHAPLPDHRCCYPRLTLAYRFQQPKKHVYLIGDSTMLIREPKAYPESG